MSLTTLFFREVMILMSKYPEIMGKLVSLSISTESKNRFFEVLIDFDNETDPYEKKGILDTFQEDFEDLYPDLFPEIEDEIKDLYIETGLEVDEW